MDSIVVSDDDSPLKRSCCKSVDYQISDDSDDSDDSYESDESDESWNSDVDDEVKSDNDVEDDIDEDEAIEILATRVESGVQQVLVKGSISYGISMAVIDMWQQQGYQLKKQPKYISFDNFTVEWCDSWINNTDLYAISK